MWRDGEQDALQNHFKIQSKADGTWGYVDSPAYNDAVERIQNKYTAAKNQLDTQQQIHATVEPTLAEILSLQTGAFEAAAGEAGIVVSKIMEGARSGPGVHEPLLAHLAKSLASMVDPSTISTDDSDGRPFGAAGARRWVDEYVHELYKDKSPKDRAKYAINFGTGSATVQALFGNELARQVKYLLQLNSIQTPGEAILIEDPLTGDKVPLPTTERT